MLDCRCITRNFLGQVKGQVSGGFSPRFSWSYILNRKCITYDTFSIQNTYILYDLIRAFVSKIKTLSIFKKGTRVFFLFPLSHPSDLECGWKTMTELWIWMMVLHVWQASFEHASGYKRGSVLNMACRISNGYAKFQICLIMTPYISIMP